MPDFEHVRYLASYAQGTSVTELEAGLKCLGIVIVDRYDFIRTLVLTGDRDTILALPQTFVSVTSVEREGPLV